MEKQYKKMKIYEKQWWMSKTSKNLRKIYLESELKNEEKYI